MFPFKNLGQLIGRERDLSKIAIVDLGGGGGPREFSYAALDAMANGVARALLRDGFKRGDRIAILSANRTEYIAACFGIMRAGLVAVPVNFKFPKKTIDFVVRDAGAKLVFCDAERRADCPNGLPVVCFGEGGKEGFDKFLDPGSFTAVTPLANEPAMFLYTSGSTGIPKGVVLSHQSHLWVVETRLSGQDLSGQRYLIAAPLYHMNALALAQLAIAAHSTIVLLPNFTARSYIAAIEKYRCTWLTAVPPMIAMMLREADVLAKTDLSSVQFVRMGSAPVSQSLMSALRRALPQAAVTNAYGTTEAGPVVFGPHPKGLPTPDMSVGYPHPKVQLRLVDGSNENAAQGVLEMKCPAVMIGYHNRPDVASPIGPDGFYRTGDVFRRDARRVSLFHRPHRRHVQLRRREHLSGRRRAHAGNPCRCQPGGGRADRRRHQGPEAGRLHHCRRPGGIRPWTRSSTMRSPMRRPISIRALSGSSTSCRSRRPTRSTAMCCKSSPRNG